MTKMVLVHGMNGTKESWNTLPKLLEDAGYSVEAIDLPGHQTDLSIWNFLNAGQ